MAEYIRKDHAINLARASDGERRGKEWLVKQLEMIHPADVRPVVRGKWLHEDSASNYLAYKCSVCGMGGRLYKFPFCSQCGADMRGGDAK